MNNLRFYVTLLLLLPWAQFIGSQEDLLLPSKSILAGGTIFDMKQDLDGNILIATEKGLNIFDGAKCTLYNQWIKVDGENAIASVISLEHDLKGRTWVGRSDGMSRFDHRTRKAHEVVCRSASGEPMEVYVKDLASDKNGRIWVATLGHGVFCIEGDEDVAIQTGTGKAVDFFVNAITMDTNGNIYAGTERNGVQAGRLDDRRDIHWQTVKGTEQLKVTAIALTEEGAIFAGTENGLYHITHNGVCSRIAQSEGFYIRCLHVDYRNRLLIGTHGQGLQQYNLATEKILPETNPLGSTDLYKTRVWAIFEDQGHHLWFGLQGKGVARMPAVNKPFRSLRIPRNTVNETPPMKNVTALGHGPNGDIYAGTDGGGLYRFNADRQFMRHYSIDDGYDLPIAINTIQMDSCGGLWIGGTQHGLGRINPVTGVCHYIKAIDSTNVTGLIPDGKRTLRVATLGAGLYQIDLEGNLISRETGRPADQYDPAINTLNNRWINGLSQGRNDLLYINTCYGLGCYDPQTQSFLSRFTQNRILGGISVITSCEDSDGNLWAGTTNGLYCLEADNKSLRKYDTQHGLPDNSITGLTIDLQNNLWISTSYGIARWDHRKKTFTAYYAEDGLLGNEFIPNSILVASDGWIYIGGTEGVTCFLPETIDSIPPPIPRVRIVDFYLHGQPITTETFSGKVPVIGEGAKQDVYHLAAVDNSFGIEFATAQPGSGQGYRFFYSLNKGEWNALPNGVSKVNFSELAPGRHTVSVKAGREHPQSQACDVMIQIRPHWYATTIAIIFWSLLALAAIGLIISLTRRFHRLHIQQLQQAQQEEINEAKLQFLFNIAHEIRTPMCLISNPLKNLIATDGDQERQRQYHIINRNTNRLLQLVNQLMDLRKLDKGQMKLNFIVTDLVTFVRQVIALFEEQIEEKGIKFRLDVVPSTIEVCIDQHNFDKVLVNLMANALKYTPSGGSITLNLRSEGDGIHIELSDNGPGIPKAEQKHIFEQFYRINTPQNQAISGTGLGLHLVQLLVTLHHGTIEVHNRQTGQGTCFSITLPHPDHFPETLSTSAVPYTSEEKTICVQPSVPETAHHHPTRSRFNIMIVEDDEDIRSYLRQELVSDYHISECANGKEALEQISINRPNLIISDVMMPQMDGITLCRKVKQNIDLNDIPIILLTARTQEEDTLLGLDSGADSYMTKPFNMLIMRNTIANLLRNRETLRNRYLNKQLPEEQMEELELKSPDEKLMERVMRFINLHIANPDYTVGTLASDVGISRVHLNRKLKELTNQTSRDFIRNVRLHLAADLLKNKDIPITELAAAVGIPNITNFSSAFKEQFGLSPTKYRAKEASQK